MVRVATANCDGDTCPGVICGTKIVQANDNNTYDLICNDGKGNGIVGNHV